jgi:hypothetical protein
MGDDFSLNPVPGTGQVVRETNTVLVVRDAAIVAGVGGWVASMATSGASANVGMAMLEMSKGLPFIAPVSPPSRAGFILCFLPPHRLPPLETVFRSNRVSSVSSLPTRVALAINSFKPPQ